MIPAILLCGRKQVGKDTTARFIESLMVGYYPDKLKRTVSIAQSDPMKDFCRDALNMGVAQLWGNEKEKDIGKPRADVEKMELWARDLLRALPTHREMAIRALHIWWGGIPKVTTPRHILQTLGTEWGRKVDPDLWANHAWRRVYEELAEGTPGGLGIPANLVVVTDGRFRNEVLAAKRNGAHVVKIQRGTALIDRHASETGLDDVPTFWFDEVITNDGTLAELQVNVRLMLTELGYIR